MKEGDDMATTTRTGGCPACSEVRAEIRDDLHQGGAVVECAKCGGIYTTRRITLGDSFGIVHPRWCECGDGIESRYFDLDTFGSEGLGRRHGWACEACRQVTQVG